MPAQPRRAQQRGGEEVVPLLLGDAEDRRAIRGSIPAARSRSSSSRRELRGQPAHPAVGRPAGLAVQGAERRGRTPRRGRGSCQWASPWSRNAAQKRISRSWTSASVSAPVASSSRSRWRTGAGGGGVNGGQVADPVAADPPEGLEREPLPVVVAPVLDRRLAEPVEQLGEALGDPRRGRARRGPSAAGSLPPRRSRITQRRVSAISRARTAEDASWRTRRRAFASATYQTSSSVGPVRSGYWSIASRRSSRVPKQGISSARPVAEVLLQHLLELGEPDPAPPQLLAVAVLGQVRAGSRRRARPS